MKHLRHGDLIFTKVSSIPKEATITNNPTLALGEFTGHSHTLVKGKFKIFNMPTGQKFLEVETPSRLTHQEHKPIEFPKGRYRMDFEVEFDPFAEKIRQVQD